MPLASFSQHNAKELVGLRNGSKKYRLLELRGTISTTFSLPGTNSFLGLMFAVDTGKYFHLLLLRITEPNICY